LVIATLLKVDTKFSYLTLKKKTLNPQRANPTAERVGIENLSNLYFLEVKFICF